MITPMISQLIGAITNIILDPIFIFQAGEGIGLPFGLDLALGVPQLQQLLPNVFLVFS